MFFSRLSEGFPDSMMDDGMGFDSGRILEASRQKGYIRRWIDNFQDLMRDILRIFCWSEAKKR